MRYCEKNIVQPDRPQMTIRCMHISCCITKATNTHSQYVMLIAFPLQQWLGECASMLRYTYIVNRADHTFCTAVYLNCGPRNTAVPLEVSMTTKISPLAFTGNFFTCLSAVLSMVILWAQLVKDSPRRCLKRVLLGSTEGRKRFIGQLDITQILTF